MKKAFTLSILLMSVSLIFAQPILVSDSLHTGSAFNLYSLSNVNTANLVASGANVTWDISSATATLAGTAEFLDMDETPYALEYPAANFAMKFSITGMPDSYSLFNHTSTVLEEVANNVGTSGPVSFLNYRTSLVFPFTFNLINTDSYQKENQNVKTIINNYDGYGDFITNTSTNNNVVRININDEGNQSIGFWSSSPLAPVFQASSGGFILWKLTSTTTGIKEKYVNRLFDLYPNPATSELHIVNKELISRLDIYSIDGKFQFSTTSAVIDISGLTPGVYVVKATSKTGSISQRFIRE